MKKFTVGLMAVVTLALLAVSVDAGPFGIFGGRRGQQSAGACANGSCGQPAAAGYEPSYPQYVPNLYVQPTAAAPVREVVPAPAAASPFPGIVKVTYTFSDGTTKTVDLSK